MNYFAIFGDPVEHSMSPLLHNLAFTKLGLQSCYTRHLLKDGTKLKETFLELHLSGANITLPHKLEAFKACDELDEFAKKVGSVNTIVKRQDRLYGYNTDAPGFLRSIECFDQIKSTLLLGAGGTARSVSVALRDAGYSVKIANRSQNRLESFEKDGFSVSRYESMDKSERFDLVINTTSAGLNDDLLPASEELLKPLVGDAKGCVDIIYGKQTPFLSLAQQLGVEHIDGSEMLLQQAVLAFDHFTDGKYDRAVVEKNMRRGFEL